MPGSICAVTPGVLTSFLLYAFAIGGGAFYLNTLLPGARFAMFAMYAPRHFFNLPAFAGFAGLFGSIMSAVGATERVYQIIDRVPLLDNTAGDLIRADLRGEVELRGVSFAYPSRPNAAILRQASLKICAGTVAAIVG
jgi:ABC-type multidrug transport system fused ATPase/permease subunit